MKEKENEILLEDSDVRYCQYLYMNEWTNNGQLGGPETWWKVFQQMLKDRGYKVVKEGK